MFSQYNRYLEILLNTIELDRTASLDQSLTQKRSEYRILSGCRFRGNRTHNPELFAHLKRKENWSREFYSKCAKWPGIL
jgi:hypothetical protein